MPDNGLNDEQENMVPVTLPSGALFFVHEKEFQYFKDRSSKYLSDNDFQNVSDYQDVDRLLVAELFCYRWGLWISNQRDYWGESVDENQLQKSLKDHSAEIRQLKKTLGLDRETREKVRGEESVENYLHQLRIRAKHFKHNLRYPQAAKAVELFQELKGVVTFYLNCDEKERIQQGVTMDHIIKWLVEEAFPQFDEIDEKFREEQKTWIHKL